MKERPILFSAPMVRALLYGSKTQTRRVVKPQHLKFFDQSATDMLGAWSKRPMPYGKPGDRLWVRETWAHDAESLEQCRASLEDAMGGGRYGPYYRATESAPDTLYWKPSIHMPRWASRITLEITGVRVERLQNISKADAIAEGLTSNSGLYASPGQMWQIDPRKAYSNLWESINGPGSWDANPWVWVIEFKVLKGGGA